METNLAEAIEIIRDLAQEAAAPKPPQLVPLPEPGHIYALFDPDTKKLERHEARVAPRLYRCGHVEDVAKLINVFLAREETSDVFAFVQNGGVCVILNEKGDRRDRLVMNLTPSWPWKALCVGGAFSQAAFIRHLRVTLNAQYQPDDIVTAVRKLKFGSTSDGRSEVQTGRASMGKSVEAHVAGMDAGDLERFEDMTVTLPIYSDLLDPNQEYRVVTFGVECALDINVEEQKFALIPKAGELERVLLAADRRVMDTIAVGVSDLKRVHIFRGVAN